MQADIPFVASNHADLREAVEAFGIPFRHLPIDPAAKAVGKAQQERELVRLLLKDLDTWPELYVVEMLSPTAVWTSRSNDAEE